MGKRDGEGSTPRRSIKPFKIGERVEIGDLNKRMAQDIKGSLATVVDLPGNGWVQIAVDGEPVNAPPRRIQQRYLVHQNTGQEASGGTPRATLSPLPASPVAGSSGAFAKGRPLKVRIVGEIGAALAAKAAASQGGTPTGNPATPASPPAHASGGTTAAPSQRKQASAQPQTPVASPPQQPQQTPTPPASKDASVVLSPQNLKDILKKMRGDTLDAEAHIPWNAVKPYWRSRRNKWRQATKGAESVLELAARLQELRTALVAEAASFPACGPGWQAAMDACLRGTGTHAQLLGVWEELRGSIGAWLSARTKPHGHLPPTLQACVMRAVAAMQRWGEAAGDSQEEQDDAIIQVPIEAICNYSADSLAAVRGVLERERKACAKQEAQGTASPPTSPRAAHTPTHLSPQGAVEGQLASILDDPFDSGAESEAGSAVTVLSSGHSSDDAY